MNKRTNYPIVSVIIVNWNGGNHLIECLNSLENSELKNIEIIVVDNASTDNSINILEARYNYVNLIKNKYNMGFAGGNNLGAKEAKGKYIYMLNNDAKIKPDAIERLVNIMEFDENVGCCGSKIYFDHDKELINCTGHYIDNLGFLWARGFMEKDCGKYDNKQDIFMCSACSLLVRMDFINKYGLFDEDIFMYGDELELAIKVWGAGYRVVYEPKSIVYHGHAKSTSKIFSPKPSCFQIFYSNRNRIKIVLKYYPLDLIFKNFFLIIFSLIYWDLYIFKCEGFKKFSSAIYSQIVYAKNGIFERKSVSSYKSINWKRFIKCRSLLDLFTFAINHNNLYLGLNKRL